MTSESQTRGRSNIALIGLVVVLMVSTGFLGAYTLELNRQLQEVSAELSKLNVAQSQIDNRLDKISRQVEQTITTTQTVSITATETQATYTETRTLQLNASAVFDQVKESVVAITVLVLQGVGQGSGFVYDNNGHIVTNNHVVEGAEEITVTFLDGTTVDADLVGADPYTDLAVIAVDPTYMQLKSVTLGDSSALKVGDPVIAIGNPFGLSGTLTTGVISQKGRILPTAAQYSIPGVLQIDAAVNPGNSGGPLLNYNGEVVGVTTAIESPTRAFVGIGFAIPSNTVARVVKSLIEVGYYKHSWLGIAGIELNPAIVELMNLNVTRGFLIQQVVKDGPAYKAGLKGGDIEVLVGRLRILIGGDVIIRIDDIDVRNLEDILTYLEEDTRPGQTVVFTILRDNLKMNIDVVVGERPPP